MINSLARCCYEMSASGSRREPGTKRLPLEFGHFREQKPTVRPGELGLLGVGRGSPGPKGLKNLAQDLPLGFWFSP
jgi:hypothetical protein